MLMYVNHFPFHIYAVYYWNHLVQTIIVQEQRMVCLPEDFFSIEIRTRLLLCCTYNLNRSELHARRSKGKNLWTYSYGIPLSCFGKSLCTESFIHPNFTRLYYWHVGCTWERSHVHGECILLVYFCILRCEGSRG